MVDVTVILIVLPVLISMGLLWLAAPLLFRRGWLLPWLRGSAGLLLLALSAVGGVLAWYLGAFVDTKQTAPLAQVELFEMRPHKWRVLIKLYDGRQESAVLAGDVWNVEMEVLNFPFSQTVGRILALGERYTALEKEQQAQEDSEVSQGGKRSYSIPCAVLDSWSLMQFIARSQLVKARRMESPWMPMRDGARYSIRFKDGKFDIRSAAPLS